VDELTDLPNKRQIDERLRQELARCQRRQEDIAVLYIDLDRFKEINDCYGHEAGDDAIKEFGRRLKKVIREEDAIARLGGDEFGAIITNVDSGDVVKQVANRLFHEMQKPFLFGDTIFYTTASVGAAVIHQGTVSMAEAVRQADFALLKAKNDGRNRLRIFDPEMADRIKQKRIMETDLRHAMAQGQIVLEYQPQLDHHKNRIIGVEALVRWQHPTKGLLPPGDFIAVAEETGVIHELGELILRRACMEIRGLDYLKLAVNVSPVQFRQADFVENVKRILKETNFDPARLELEITEGIFITNPAHAAKIIEQLRALGIGVALDDFGTGYSSMSYLSDYALDRIKIDKSFINRIGESKDAENIVASMIQLAGSLGLKVTVEGVEHTAQAERLEKYQDCEMQGFLFSRPVRLDHLRNLYDGSKRRAVRKPLTPPETPSIALSA
jgi:diguanylate cyclase (GGDEF)-like protein